MGLEMLRGEKTKVQNPPQTEEQLEDTLEGFRALVDGEVDDLPEQAFLYVGSLDEAREKAKTLAQ